MSSERDALGRGSNIVVFLGSVRDGRMVERVWKFVKTKMEEMQMNYVLFDPKEMEFEMLRMPLHFMEDQSKAPEWLKEANKKLLTADGFIIVTPEYNCCLPPALTNMMDHFSPASFKHRPCGIVTYSVGLMGGGRATMVCRPFLADLGMFGTPSYTVIPNVWENIDDCGNCSNESVSGSIQRLLNEVRWYSAALANHKQLETAPTVCHETI